jgi:hypothetical protein
MKKPLEFIQGICVKYQQGFFVNEIISSFTQLPFSQQTKRMGILFCYLFFRNKQIKGIYSLKSMLSDFSFELKGNMRDLEYLLHFFNFNLLPYSLEDYNASYSSYFLMNLEYESLFIELRDFLSSYKFSPKLLYALIIFFIGILKDQFISIVKIKRVLKICDNKINLYIDKLYPQIHNNFKRDSYISEFT